MKLWKMNGAGNSFAIFDARAQGRAVQLLSAHRQRHGLAGMHGRHVREGRVQVGQVLLRARVRALLKNCLTSFAVFCTVWRSLNRKKPAIEAVKTINIRATVIIISIRVIPDCKLCAEYLLAERLSINMMGSFFFLASVYGFSTQYVVVPCGHSVGELALLLFSILAQTQKSLPSELYE